MTRFEAKMNDNYRRIIFMEAKRVCFFLKRISTMYYKFGCCNKIQKVGMAKKKAGIMMTISSFFITFART